MLHYGLRPTEEVDRSITFYIALVLLLTTIGLSVVVLQGYVFHREYPRNTLLFLPASRFTDFNGAAIRVRHFGDPEMMSRRDFGGKGYEVFPYPIPAVYPHLLFNQFAHPLRVYLGMVICFALTVAAWFVTNLKRLSKNTYLPYWAVLITVLTPFPFLFLIDRGNLEGLVWIFVLLGIYLFYKQVYYWSAFVLALAAAMKLFPALLFLLFIAKKKYYAFATAIVTAGVVTILSWAGVSPNLVKVAVDSSQSGSMLRDLYIVGFRPVEIGWDHSILGGAKQLLYAIAQFRHIQHDPKLTWISVPGVATATAIYGILAPLAFVVLYWRVIYWLPVLNQLIAFLALCVLLPFVSNEYTLVHIYVAWGAFLFFLYQDVRPGRVSLPFWKVTAILACFAFVFSPQSYWVFGYIDNLGGQIKMCALLCLLGLVVATPMPSTAFQELPSA